MHNTAPYCTKLRVVKRDIICASLRCLCALCVWRVHVPRVCALCVCLVRVPKHVYIYVLCMSICSYVCLYALLPKPYINTYRRIGVCTYIRIGVCTYIRIDVRLHVTRCHVSFTYTCHLSYTHSCTAWARDVTFRWDVTFHDSYSCFVRWESGIWIRDSPSAAVWGDSFVSVICYMPCSWQDSFICDVTDSFHSYVT